MRKQEAPRLFSSPPGPGRVRDGLLTSRPSLLSSDCVSERERATIMIPTGNLEKDVKSFFKAIGLQFEDTDRKYFIRVENMPVDFVLLRAKDIPKLVGDPFPNWGTIGVTGSDILWEQEQEESALDRNSGEDLPIEDLVPGFKKSSLFVGVTNDFVKRIREKNGRNPQLKDLATRVVVTKLPRIAKEVFAGKGIGTNIQRVSGAEEAWQYLNRAYFEGVFGVIQTRETTKLNDIQVLEKFYDVSIRLISARLERYDSRVSRNELSILEDLREMTYVALQRKRMI